LPPCAPDPAGPVLIASGDHRRFALPARETPLIPQALPSTIHLLMKSFKLSFFLIAAMLLGSLATLRADSSIPKSYPLTKCPVSDDKLGEHGKAVKVTYKGTDVYLCCRDCKKDFDKNPAKYVKLVKDANAAKK
jgi:YHS domain-containing protein